MRADIRMLRSEISTLRSEMPAEFRAQRTEMRAELRALRDMPRGLGLPRPMSGVHAVELGSDLRRVLAWHKFAMVAVVVLIVAVNVAIKVYAS